MIDFETYVITVYVMVDQALTRLPPLAPRPGRHPALSRSELVTLALIAQLDRFASERAFARFAVQRLRPLFPRLPDRSQLHRAMRTLQATCDAVRQQWGDQLDAAHAPYELLDGTAMPLRNASRRGHQASAAFAAYGRGSRLGWFYGCRVLVTATPAGVVTGYAIAAGNTHDSTLAETFFAERASATPSAAVGSASSGSYLADKAYSGRAQVQRWALRYAATVTAPPKHDSRDRWSEAAEQAHAHKRQMIETVFQRLLHGLRLERDRPRTEQGLKARLAAKCALSNGLILWNRTEHRPDLAFASVIGW
jgi:hypothetical protein